MRMEEMSRAIKKSFVVTSPTKMQHNLNTVVGLDMKHLLTTTKYNVTNSNKQGHNNNNDTTTTTISIISTRTVASKNQTFIGHN